MSTERMQEIRYDTRLAYFASSVMLFGPLLTCAICWVWPSFQDGVFVGVGLIFPLAAAWRKRCLIAEEPTDA